MNVRQSVARLPESIAGLIAASAAVRPQIERGEPLNRIIGSSEWADRWQSGAEPKTVGLLATIVASFAAVPFGLEQLVNVCEAGSPAQYTGSEIRVGLASLRLHGIVFAVRKAWGDQLFYIPTDMVPSWQRRLLPVQSIRLPAGESRPLTDPDKRFRLPLSLEMLLSWQCVADQPIAFTAKRTLHRKSVAKLIAPMRIASQELETIGFAYPDAEHLPRQAALAIDLGLSAGVLVRTERDIRIDERGLSEWLALSVQQADARLHEFLLERYAAADPQMHLAASAVATLQVGVWLETRLFETVAPEAKADAWLRLLECCGWVERGSAAGRPAFRMLNEFPAREAEKPDAEPNEGTFIVQPDGEIIVPPDVGLAARWTLGRTTERVAADALFVYRLTRDACAKAIDAGYSRQTLIDFLERGSGESLPSQVADALNDWYARLGRTKFEDALLLRTDSPAIAKLLLDDPELVAHKPELVGDRDFIVDAGARKAIEARLSKLGYPPAAAKRHKPPNADAGEDGDVAAGSEHKEPGWIYRPFALGYYEADPSIPAFEDLFPGMLDIPSAWVKEPRAYHASTRESLVQRAISWQTSLLVRREGVTKLFVPRALERQGDGFRAIGHWRGEADEPQKLVEVSACDLAELMINLPSLDVT
ncbi:helicase-associated domain-containing protein [Cohnella panacarvi]|uniref:helicase-associated domain-containing protein n=1 Tax=Cohnella panacarvi TaxID=400776 RepID=UPI00047CBB95|nr:helicase-associated domain-containing protein [Cohnella panacarvi]